MTAEALLARKRELLHARRGETDTFNRFFLNEELADLNAQLRSLRGAPRAGRATGSALALARKQYRDWLAGERGEADAARRACRDALEHSADVLTPRQRELFDAWRAGGSVTALAARFGVGKSTVSRTLARCRARLRAEAAARANAPPDTAALDLADGATARLVLSCLTARQAACLYLYYGEWLSLRECGELLGVGHTAVLRTVRRALGAIRDTLRCGAFTLENADALSGFAYALYAEAGMPDDVPAEPPKAARARRTPIRAAAPPADCTVRTSDGLVDARGTAHRSLDRPMSELLTLLYALRRKGPLYPLLARLFAQAAKTQ